MKITKQSIKHSLIGFTGDVLLLLAFTYLWEHVNAKIEHFGEMISFTFLRMAMHNWLHSQSHQLLHRAIHSLFYHKIAKRVGK